MTLLCSTPLKDPTQLSRGSMVTTGSIGSPDTTGHLIFRDNPFAGISGNYQVIPFKEGSTITEIVNATCAENSWLINYLEVKIADQVVPRESWDRVRLKKDAPITLMVVPQGGNTGTILRTVAMVAIAVVAAVYLGPAVAGYFQFATNSVGFAMSVAMTSMAVSMVASAALNALFPPPSAQMPSISTDGSTQSNTYGFSLDTNTSWQYKPVPRVYGRVKMAPPYGARPFIESIGDKQYMYLLFDLGYGPLKLEDLRIGENPISYYTDVEYYIHESYTSSTQLKLYNKDVWQDAFGFKIDQNVWRMGSTQKLSDQAVIDFTFAQGLGRTNQQTGALESVSVDLQLQWRKVGDATWNGYGSLPNTFVGDVVKLDTNTFQVTRSVAKPFTITTQLIFPSADEYEIRVTRNSADAVDRYTADDVILSSIRSIKNISPINVDVPHTVVEMKIMANDQLSGMVNNFSCIATSMLQTYDSAGNPLGVVPTRNPAWHYLDVLLGTGAVRPAKLSRINMPAFVAWAKWNDTAVSSLPGEVRSQCDLVVNGEYTTWQILKLIASTGDATPSMLSGKYSISIDRPRSVPVQMFTPRNSSDFHASRSYHIQPDALRVHFIDPNQEWQQREILVYDDGKDESNSTIFENLELNGITNYHHAYRIGRHTLAQGRLRQETFSIKVGVENILAARGDLVKLTHDVPKIGTGWARIKVVSGNNITLDAPFTAMAIGYVCTIRTQYLQTTMKVVDVLSNDTVTVEGNTAGLQPGQLLVYGEAEKVTMECMVKSIHPGADLTATIDLVPYAREIYNSENAPIPVYNPLITNLNDMRCGPVISLQAAQVDNVINRYHYISIVLSWRAPTGLFADHYDIYQYTDDKWIKLGSTTDCTYYAFKDIKAVDDNGDPAYLIGKRFIFSVVAVSRASTKAIAPSLAPRALITPLRDTVKPEAPSFFDLDIRSKETIYLEWGRSFSNDVDYYIIRYSPLFNGADFDTATMVATRIPYSSNSITVPARLGTYFIKTVDTTGNVSPDAARCITPTATLTDDVVIVRLEESLFPGALNGMQHFGDTAIETGYQGFEVIDPINPPPQGDFPFIRANTNLDMIPFDTNGDLPFYEATIEYDPIILDNFNGMPFHRYGELYNQGGSYVYTEIVNVGGIYPTLFSAHIEAHGLKDGAPLAKDEVGGQWDAWFEIRTSENTPIDDISGWSTWRKFYAGEYTGKYFQFRLCVASNSKEIGVRVTRAYVDVSARVRMEGEYDVPCSAGGTYITFDPPYREQPAIAITQDNAQAGDQFTITNKSRLGFSIKFTDKNGAAVARQFDWIARGHGKEVFEIPPYSINPQPKIANLNSGHSEYMEVMKQSRDF